MRPQGCKILEVSYAVQYVTRIETLRTSTGQFKEPDKLERSSMFTSAREFDGGVEGLVSNRETSPTHRAVADVVGAVLSGLFVGFILGWTRTSGDEVYLHELTRIMLLAVCSYLFATLVVNTWKGRPLKKAPNWVLIAIGGSLLFFLIINLIPDARYLWKFRNSAEIGYASGAMRDEFVRLIMSTVMDSLISLVILGTVHYTAQKLKKLWGSFRHP